MRATLPSQRYQQLASTVSTSRTTHAHTHTLNESSTAKTTFHGAKTMLQFKILLVTKTKRIRRQDALVRPPRPMSVCVCVCVPKRLRKHIEEARRSQCSQYAHADTTAHRGQLSSRKTHYRLDTDLARSTRRLASRLSTLIETYVRGLVGQPPTVGQTNDCAVARTEACTSTQAFGGIGVRAHCASLDSYHCGMENGDWRVDTGEWRAEGGEWRIKVENGLESGECRVEDGDWRMRNGE